MAEILIDKVVEAAVMVATLGAVKVQVDPKFEQIEAQEMEVDKIVGFKPRCSLLMITDEGVLRRYKRKSK